jgi:hypothetical protein
MMDESMHQTFAGDVELTRRLEAFAAARLSPDAAAVKRMRSRVMREVRASFETRLPATLAPVTGSGPVAVPIPLRGYRPGLRRTAGLLLAAALSISVIGGSAIAATPGGPLYGTALWLEELTLPSGGDARFRADLGRLERRLNEARAAAASANGGGMAAALAAYRKTVDDAVAAAGTDGAWLARLEAALGNHVAVLTALSGRVPEQARGAIQQAIDKSNRAKEHIGGPKGPNAPAVPGGQGPIRTPEPHPARTPRPEPGRTQKPAKTTVPAVPPVTEAPRATPGPGRTPSPAPHASPGRSDR